MSPTESRSYRAQAVVLRHQEYGEADRILTLYSREHGKINAIAKGVRKLKSHKAGHLEPFTLVALQLAKGRNLDIVTQAEAIKTYPGLRKDLKLTAYAAYMVELLDRFTFEEGQNQQLFSLLTSALERLSDGSPSATVVHYFEIHLMQVLGFKPELNHCVACGQEIKPQNQFFSARLGGLLCPNCTSADPSAWKVSLGVLKYLRYFQRSPWSKLSQRIIPLEIEVEFRALMERYFTYLLEYNLKTPGFLDAVS